MNDLPSGGCPTYDGIVAVLVAMGQTGQARETMNRNNCLPFSPKMRLQVEGTLSNNILRVTTPDFPGSGSLFVSGSGYRKVTSPNVVSNSQSPLWFSEAKINKALVFLSSYQDVPPSANCTSPRSKTEQLICSSPSLRLAEMLNTRADVYATENATKSELNHRRFRGKLPTSCFTVNCVFESFRSSTNDFLGGESPYSAQ